MTTTTTTTTTTNTATATETTDDDERTTQIFFLLFSAILVIVLFLSRFLEESPRLRTYISEPAMILLVGMFCSLIVRLLNESDYEEYQNHYQSEHDGTDDYFAFAYDNQYHNDGEDFNESEYASKYMRALPNFLLLFPSKVFFLALLPPILFNSGYQLQRELFYRHFGAIALFSIGGTVLSAFGAGGFLWFLSTKGWLGDAFNPTPLELLTFGALIAATDTVSVVGVLQRKRVDPHLFSLVFGESALNDAVALVLFKTLADFLRQNAMQNYDNDNNNDLYKNVGKYLLDLLVQCVVSPILGLVFASLMGLAFKHGRMRDHKLLELSLYIMPVYIPFMLSELLELSGMITIFFTGIFARRYMEPNVSEETREYARIIFRLLAFLAEVCIFLELGLSVCGMHRGHFSWPFVSWAFVAALLGRAIGVYPLSFLYNLSLTRPIDNTANKTVAVEMMSSSKFDSKKDMMVDIETPTRDCNSTKEDFYLFDDDIIEKGGNRIPDILPTALSSPGRACEASVGNDSTASSNTSSADKSVMSTSFYELMPTVVSKRETPERKRDKIIPVKFMHLLWFAGLRGAVAYACAREFPDVYGHRDEFTAATMVIVVITIVLMGGATEPLMDRLGIRMNVDNDEYMRAWHQQRKLKGKLLHFEYHWIYRFVVRDQSIQFMNESCGYIEQVDEGLDNDIIVKLVLGENLGATFAAQKHRQAEHKHLNSRGKYRVHDYRRRKPSQKDLFGLDCSIVTEDSSSSNERSLIEDQDEEDIGGYSNLDNDFNRSRRSGECASVGTHGGRSTPVQSNMSATTANANADTVNNIPLD